MEIEGGKELEVHVMGRKVCGEPKLFPGEQSEGGVTRRRDVGERSVFTPFPNKKRGRKGWKAVLLMFG